MTTQDFQVAEQARTKRLRFDRYLLDLDRGCLFVDGNELALRPKTFAVLLYLVEHPGRLVSKDELLSAVWPNLAITDDALVQRAPAIVGCKTASALAHATDSQPGVILRSAQGAEAHGWADRSG